MNLLFISQCQKRALTETRRVLDQFGERKGHRVWQTSMTEEGMLTVRRLLRKTARKNTAVACHWVRSANHTELLWLVGDRSRFDESGTVPTNYTERNVLRAEDEDQWHSGEAIHLLSGMAALLHDLGKASDDFQARLRGKGPAMKNVYRHEWVSLRLFETFVAGRSDEEWLSQLQNPESYSTSDWLEDLKPDECQAPSMPFESLPPLAQAIGWLILSHHRLPEPPNKVAYADLKSVVRRIRHDWNETGPSEAPPKAEDYWKFSRGLPVEQTRWQGRASRFARRLLALHEREKDRGWLDDPFVMHLSRLTLMLADHNASSKESPLTHGANALYANTKKDWCTLDQELGEHLEAVTSEAGYVAYGLSTVRSVLPAIARHRALRRRSENPRFRWQDRSADLTESVRDKAHKQGAFFVNMASTGAGKTFANARIMYALADPRKGARFSVALGLRTLTLQTGAAYRERLGFGDDELAIRVGGTASKTLFEMHQDEAASRGSESAAPMMYDHDYVVYEGGHHQNQVLQRMLLNPMARKLIDAPVLTCTIDHLMPATESQRGGHQMAAMLRLLTSDLVLDEVDDFGLDDLPAVARLIHWAGMLGSRVMLSSATLPPSLVETLFDAYRAGRAVYQKNVGDGGARSNVVCAWFDENQVASEECADSGEFAKAHQSFVEKRAEFLSTQPVRRIPTIADFSALTLPRDDVTSNFAEMLLDEAIGLHQTHAWTDEGSGKQVSCGLLRMANIQAIVATARKIFSAPSRPDVCVHLCVYHSQHPLIVRSHIENVLDRTLRWGAKDSPANSPDVQEALRRHEAKHHIFIVLASPVAEVGRDHDYDWAIVEPSSVRSFIQLAGRVRRHRHDEVTAPNVVILSHNVRALKGGQRPHYIRPGFEGERRSGFVLASSDIRELLAPGELDRLDARPRILERSDKEPRRSLVDLEHARLRDLLTAENPSTSQEPAPQRRGRRAAPVLSIPKLSAADWWNDPRAHLSYILQCWKRFRLQTYKMSRLVFLQDELTEELVLHKEHKVKRGESSFPPVPSELHRVKDEELESSWVFPWATRELEDLLESVGSDGEGYTRYDALRFTMVDVPESTEGWRYHPFLGFFGL